MLYNLYAANCSRTNESFGIDLAIEHSKTGRVVGPKVSAVRPAHDGPHSAVPVGSCHVGD